MKPVRAPSGKLLFLWDPEKMIIHIIHKKQEVWVHLRRDGTYTIVRRPGETTK